MEVRLGKAQPCEAPRSVSFITLQTHLPTSDRTRVRQNKDGPIWRFLHGPPPPSCRTRPLGQHLPTFLQTNSSLCISCFLLPAHGQLLVIFGPAFGDFYFSPFTNAILISYQVRLKLKTIKQKKPSSKESMNIFGYHLKKKKKDQT